MSRRLRFAGNPPGFYLKNLREHEDAVRSTPADIDEETRVELLYRRRMIEGAALRACVAMLREIGGAS